MCAKSGVYLIKRISKCNQYSVFNNNDIHFVAIYNYIVFFITEYILQKKVIISQFKMKPLKLECRPYDI